MKRRQLISSDEAKPATCQHKKPCSDCPWARASLNGWLGGQSAEEWLANAHGGWGGQFVGEQIVECHAHTGVQCAGIAIYRSNVCKQVRKPNIELPPDRKLVFATPMEFLEHHSKPMKPKKIKAKPAKAKAIPPGYVMCRDCGHPYMAGKPHVMFCEAHTCSECGTSGPDVIEKQEDGQRLCENCQNGGPI